MTTDAQDRIEHLKMIQGVVTRMAGNSAQMKAWAVSLVTAAFVFSGLSEKPHWLIGVGACVPVIAFWWMDARYLHLEKCYRALYEAVISGKTVKPLDLDYRPYVAGVGLVWKVAWTWSVCTFYGALLVVVLGLLLILAK